MYGGIEGILNNQQLITNQVQPVRRRIEGWLWPAKLRRNPACWGYASLTRVAGRFQRHALPAKHHDIRLVKLSDARSLLQM
jgi:hypothetical protein